MFAIASAKCEFIYTASSWRRLRARAQRAEHAAITLATHDASECVADANDEVRACETRDQLRNKLTGFLVGCFESGGLHEVRNEGGLAVVENRVELFFYAAVSGRDLFYDRFEIAEVVKLGVEQVRSGDVR